MGAASRKGNGQSTTPGKKRPAKNRIDRDGPANNFQRAANRKPCTLPSTARRWNGHRMSLEKIDGSSLEAPWRRLVISSANTRPKRVLRGLRWKRRSGGTNSRLMSTWRGPVIRTGFWASTANLIFHPGKSCGRRTGDGSHVDVNSLCVDMDNGHTGTDRSRPAKTVGWCRPRSRMRPPELSSA